MSDTAIWSKTEEVILMMRNSKKGSSAVFLTMISAAILTISLSLVYSAREYAKMSMVDGAVSLAGDSVMSDFNYYVQKDYGLFMIKGSDNELSAKMKKYILPTIKDIDEAELGMVRVSGGRFSLDDTTQIKEQIKEHMKFIEANRLMEIISGEKDDAANNMGNAYLRHGPTIASLPSASIPSGGLTSLGEYVADKADSIDEVFRSGTEKYILNQYIFCNFNSRTKLADEEHFFKNEVEYILGGEYSDRKNEKRVEMALKAMRIPLNLAYLYSNKEKMAALMAAAELITPGAAAPATQLVLASTWAYAEADNDIELLWQGHKVPVLKEDSTWAIELDTAIEGLTGGTVVPAVEKGYDYEDYLNILLYFQNENIKIGRILDLIQINVRKCYDSDFVIGEHSTGIDIEVEVDERTYRYEKKY